MFCSHFNFNSLYYHLTYREVQCSCHGIAILHWMPRDKTGGKARFKKEQGTAGVTGKQMCNNFIPFLKVLFGIECSLEK